jgi:hypothetical protein
MQRWSSSGVKVLMLRALLIAEEHRRRNSRLAKQPNPERERSARRPPHHITPVSITGPRSIGLRVDIYARGARPSRKVILAGRARSRNDAGQRA